MNLNIVGKVVRWVIGTAVVGGTLLATGCSDSGVGDPCIPEDEYRADFAGFDEGEVNIESRSFQCVTRVCLVNNFRGRVSCPYGQGEGEEKCNLPDYSGRVTVPVKAQLATRRPSDAVYCSCRCRGPQAAESAQYCECPSGFKCEDLIDDVGLGKKELVGGYCVKDGTHVEDPTKIDDYPCDPASESCGDGSFL